jgi:hypothetical protein
MILRVSFQNVMSSPTHEELKHSPLHDGEQRTITKIVSVKTCVVIPLTCLFSQGERGDKMLLFTP